MDAFDQVVLGLDTEALKQQWARAWGSNPPANIRRAMLQKGLAFKLREQAGLGLTSSQQRRLQELVRCYKRNPAQFEQKRIKPGTRLVRTWKGQRYSVTVTPQGYVYQGRDYSSLSEIASQITGTRWNGWVFFGLKASTRKVEPS